MYAIQSFKEKAVPFPLSKHVTYFLLLLFFHLYSEMVVPEVNKNILEKLEAMGFPTARATRALYYSGELFIKSECKILFIFISRFLLSD